MDFVNWSEFPVDLLSLILEKLSLPDAIRFSAVCTQWKQIFKCEKICHSKYPPWLMLTSNNDDKIEFYSIADDKNYALPSHKSSLQFHNCIGSYDGWLIIADDLCRPQLLQPVTGSRVLLPPISTLPFIRSRWRRGRLRYFDFTVIPGHLPARLEPRDMQYNFFMKAAVSDDNSVVMMIHYGVKILSFARIGDNSWTTLKNPGGFHYLDDIIFHKGKFHTLSPCGAVYAWDWDPNKNSFKATEVVPSFYKYGTPKFSNFVDENPDFFDQPDFIKIKKFKLWEITYKYLAVSSDGNQFMVLLVRPSRETPIASLKIIVWDEKKLKWMHLKSLGRQVLFFGQGQQPMCISSDLVPQLQANCAYFFQGSAGVFSMDTKMSTTQVNGFVTPKNWRGRVAVWLTPTLF